MDHTVIAFHDIRPFLIYECLFTKADVTQMGKHRKGFFLLLFQPGIDKISVRGLQLIKITFNLIMKLIYFHDDLIFKNCNKKE